MPCQLRDPKRNDTPRTQSWFLILILQKNKIKKKEPGLLEEMCDSSADDPGASYCAGK